MVDGDVERLKSCRSWSAMTAAQPGRSDTEGGDARVARWFLRVVLRVSVAAWSALVLAELRQLRPGLLAFLLAVAVIGFSLWGSLPAVPPAAGGGRRCRLRPGSCCAPRSSPRRTRPRRPPATPPSI